MSANGAENPIKVLIGILGIDQHEVGAITVAHLLRDAGMEVVYVGPFQLPAGLVKAAIEENVDLIGLSCHSWEYLYFLPELIEMLAAEEHPIPIVVGGSVVTAQDEQTLLGQGVRAIFGPGTEHDRIVHTIREIVQDG